MTSAQKIEMVQAIVGADEEATDDLIAVYLRLAANKMLKRLYPMDVNKQECDIPAVYDMDQVELGARLFLRRGGEGESNHEENGVNRTYDTVDDEDILSRLTPFAVVMG